MARRSLKHLPGDLRVVQGEGRFFSHISHRGLRDRQLLENTGKVNIAPLRSLTSRALKTQLLALSNKYSEGIGAENSPGWGPPSEVTFDAFMHRACVKSKLPFETTSCSAIKQPISGSA